MREVKWIDGTEHVYVDGKLVSKGGHAVVEVIIHRKPCLVCRGEHEVSGPDVVLEPKNCPQAGWLDPDLIAKGEFMYRPGDPPARPDPHRLYRGTRLTFW